MRPVLRSGPSQRRGLRERLSRHAWVVIVVLVMATLLALCGRSASAQVIRVGEIEKALVPKPSIGSTALAVVVDEAGGGRPSIPISCRHSE